jgi:non-reducing end alpha-L-arabinofuranosidase
VSASVFVGPVATEVYNPPSTGTPNVTLFNAGSSTLYLGQAGVTADLGLPLLAGQGLGFPFYPLAIYAVAAATVTTTSTTLSAAAAAGATSITVTSPTGLTAGKTITIGTGESAETNTIVSVSTDTLTLTNELEFDHASGDTVTLDSTAGGGTIIVTAGT